MKRGINTGDFFEDVSIGEKLEYSLLKVIQKKYPKAYKKEGNVKEFDIVIPEINLLIECKQDYYSHKSGKFFIEHSNYGIPSGIKATTSDWWVMGDRISYYFIKTEVLKELIKDYPMEYKNHMEYKRVNKEIYMAQPSAKVVERAEPDMKDYT